MNSEKRRTNAEVVWVSFSLPGLLWEEKQLGGIRFFGSVFWSRRFPYEWYMRVLIYIQIIITLLNYGCKSWHWRHLQGSKALEWQLITFPSVPTCPTFLTPFFFYHCYTTLVFLSKAYGNQWIQAILFSLFIICACNLNISCMVNWQSGIFSPQNKDHTFGHQNHKLKMHSWLSRHRCWPKTNLETTEIRSKTLKPILVMVQDTVI